jgi:glyoxylase-like metal-dependent hydrolase (beta-lactamase superfamily II)
MLTHAHFDHADSSAYLCQTFGIPLWCGGGDAPAIASGRVDTHGSAWFSWLQRTLLPVTAHPVARTLPLRDRLEPPHDRALPLPESDHDRAQQIDVEGTAGGAVRDVQACS